MEGNIQKFLPKLPASVYNIEFFLMETMVNKYLESYHEGKNFIFINQKNNLSTKTTHRNSITMRLLWKQWLMFSGLATNSFGTALCKFYKDDSEEVAKIQWSTADKKYK